MYHFALLRNIILLPLLLREDMGYHPCVKHVPLLSPGENAGFYYITGKSQFF